MNVVKGTTITVENSESPFEWTVFQEVEFKWDIRMPKELFINCYFIECSEVGESLMKDCVVVEDADLCGMMHAKTTKDIGKKERQFVKNVLKAVRNYKGDNVYALQVCVEVIEGVRRDREHELRNSLAAGGNH